MEHMDIPIRRGEPSEQKMAETTNQSLKRKRGIESDEEYHVSVEARRRELLAPDASTTLEQTMTPFQVLWHELSKVESPPTQLNLYAAVVCLEDQYQRWGWNEIAAKIVRNKFSSSEVSALRDTLHQLPSRVCYAMLGIDMNRDGLAIEHALSYNTARFDFERDVSALEDGPIKTAYYHFSLYFGRLAIPEADLYPCFFRSPSPQNPPVVQLEEEQTVRDSEIPPCHSHDNAPHSLQPGIALCKYLDEIDAHEYFYRKHRAAGVFHEQMTALLQQLDKNRPRSPE